MSSSEILSKQRHVQLPLTWSLQCSVDPFWASGNKIWIMQYFARLLIQPKCSALSGLTCHGSYPCKLFLYLTQGTTNARGIATGEACVPVWLISNELDYKTVDQNSWSCASTERKPELGSAPNLWRCQPCYGSGLLCRLTSAKQLKSVSCIASAFNFLRLKLLLNLSRVLLLKVISKRLAREVHCRLASVPALAGCEFRLREVDLWSAAAHLSTHSWIINVRRPRSPSRAGINVTVQPATSLQNGSGATVTRCPRAPPFVIGPAAFALVFADELRWQSRHRLDWLTADRSETVLCTATITERETSNQAHVAELYGLLAALTHGPYFCTYS